ncbi:MAG: aldo/keto reductase, partial [Microbacterium sp.]|nr:aldo/keto reductase [Microbacterium sp.]
ARQRGQSLAQMAIQWTLRDPVVASALIGASRPEQLDENLAAVDGAAFSSEELARIDAVAGRVDVNLWSTSSDL